MKSHLYSNYLDDDVVRCEYCGKNILSAKGTECERSPE